MYPRLPVPHSTSCHPLPYPLSCPRKGGRDPPKPVTDGHSTYATDKNFYFFLMTFNTTAMREKHDRQEAPNFSFITVLDNNSSKSGSALDAKLQATSGS